MHFRQASSVGFVAAVVVLGQVWLQVLQSHHVMSIHQRCILMHLSTVDST